MLLMCFSFTASQPVLVCVAPSAKLPEPTGVG